MGKVISVNFDGKQQKSEFADVRSALRRLSIAVEDGNNQSKRAFEDYVRIRSLLEDRLRISNQRNDKNDFR